MEAHRKAEGQVCSVCRQTRDEVIRTSCNHNVCELCMASQLGVFERIPKRLLCPTQKCTRQLEREEIAFGIPKDKRDEWLLSQAIDDIKIQDMEQEEERARSRIYPCLICSDEFPISEILILDNCSHRYCQECLGTYCSLKCKEGTPDIRCPDPSCRSQISTRDIECSIGKDSFSKYCEILAEKYIDLSKTAIRCPQPTCSTPMEREDPKYNLITCIKCKFSFCADCNAEWHHGVTCEQYKTWKTENDGADKHYRQWRVANKVKQCPNCRHDVEKNGGCNKITCGACKRFFCWLCNQTISGYDHFNQECKLYA